MSSPLDTVANTNVDRILQVTAGLTPPGPVCSLCFLVSDEDDDEIAGYWCTEIALTVEHDRDKALQDVDGYDRWVEGWGFEQTYTGLISIEGRPTPEFVNAVKQLDAEPGQREEDDPEFFAYRHVLDDVGRRLTARINIAPLSQDFVAHPNYAGDVDEWLPVSLRHIAPPDKLARLEAKALVPPLPEPLDL